MSFFPRRSKRCSFLLKSFSGVEHFKMKLFWAAAAFVSLLIGSGMSSADQNLPTLVIGGDDLEVLPSKYKWHVRARKAREKVEARTEDTRELQLNTAQSVGLFTATAPPSSTEKVVAPISFVCEPPSDVVGMYAYAYLVDNVNGETECIRGTSATAVVQATMSNSDVLILQLNCTEGSLSRDPTLGTKWFVKYWRVEFRGSNGIVTPCPPCDVYTMEEGWVGVNSGTTVQTKPSPGTSIQTTSFMFQSSSSSQAFYASTYDAKKGKKSPPALGDSGVATKKTPKDPAKKIGKKLKTPGKTKKGKASKGGISIESTYYSYNEGYCLYDAAPPAPVSSAPSKAPSSNPSLEPNSNPSVKPSRKPSSDPSTKPVRVASSMPSSNPSSKPSANPSSKPNANPSPKPSANPSSKPNANPSTKPSANPSFKPSQKVCPACCVNGVNPNYIPDGCPQCDPCQNPVPEQSYRYLEQMFEDDGAF